MLHLHPNLLKLGCLVLGVNRGQHIQYMDIPKSCLKKSLHHMDHLAHRAFDLWFTTFSAYRSGKEPSGPVLSWMGAYNVLILS